MKSMFQRYRKLFSYLIVHFCLLLPLLAIFAATSFPPTFRGRLFVISSLPGYALLYLLPAIVCGSICYHFVSRERLSLLGVAITAFVIHLLLLSDFMILRIMGFHANGLVWNLIVTPGGLESMGLNSSSVLSFAIVILVIAAFHAALYICWQRNLLHLRSYLENSCPTWLMALGVISVLSWMSSLLLSGLADFYWHTDVLQASSTYPFMMHMRMRSFMRSLGCKEPERFAFKEDIHTSGSLVYPLEPLTQSPEHKNYNIVWLTAESLRGTQVSPDIMPNTAALAASAIHCKNHYSGGNGTRPGMFAQFYGLYAVNWDTFLNTRTPPVLLQLLRQNNYAFLCQSSAKLTYPEFDKTIFSAMRNDELHEELGCPPQERDARNTDRLIAFVRKAHAQNQPFFAFSFFEGTHAPYSFDSTSIIRQNYTPEINYITTNKDDAEVIYNRYVNACYCLDQKFGQIFDFLKSEGLLETTIVVVTGDHGEEFFEKGRLGHNSTFTQEQTMPAMVLYYPGVTPTVFTCLTHHCDIIPTIADILGITTPPEAFTDGQSLISPSFKRDYAILCGWDEVVFVNNAWKAMLPFGHQTFMSGNVTTPDDAPVDQANDFYKQNVELLTHAMKQMKRFTR